MNEMHGTHDTNTNSPANANENDGKNHKFYTYIQYTWLNIHSRAKFQQMFKFHFKSWRNAVAIIIFAEKRNGKERGFFSYVFAYDYGNRNKKHVGIL